MNKGFIALVTWPQFNTIQQLRRRSCGDLYLTGVKTDALGDVEHLGCRLLSCLQAFVRVHFLASGIALSCRCIYCATGMFGVLQYTGKMTSLQGASDAERLN